MSSTYRYMYTLNEYHIKDVLKKLMLNSSEGSQEEREAHPHHKQWTHEEYHKDRNSQGKAIIGNKNR